MKKYEFIEHTADVGFIAYGRTARELFSNAFDAFVETIIDPTNVKADSRRNVKITSDDMAESLQKFLQKLIILSDAEGFIPLHIGSIDIKDGVLYAVIKGVIFDESKHRIKTLIKGVTYHGLAIIKINGMLKAQVILDL